jgi:hypothetical protein
LFDNLSAIYRVSNNIAMENFEGKISLLDNEEFVAKFVNTFADALEDMATDGTMYFSDEDVQLIEKFRESKELPRGHRSFRELLIRVGQDLGLTPDEINMAEEKFLV